MTITLVSLLTAVSFALATFAHAEIFQKKEIISIPWGLVDWAPFYITKGPQTGEGRVDRIKRLLAERNPDLQFVDLHADVSRLIELWKINKNACSGTVLKTPEREKWAYFTAFSFQVPHEYALVSSSLDFFFKREDTISARTILADKTIRGVFLRNRSYGPIFDEIIKAEIEKNPSIIFLRPSESYMAILKMIHKGRFDYTFEYEAVVQSFNEEIFPEKPLRYRMMKESSPSAVLYFACTKNDWGRNVVLKVDRALQKLASTKEYQSAMESWVAPEVLRKNRKALEEFYTQRSQGPWHTVPIDE